MPLGRSAAGQLYQCRWQAVLRPMLILGVLQKLKEQMGRAEAGTRNQQVAIRGSHMVAERWLCGCRWWGGGTCCAAPPATAAARNQAAALVPPAFIPAVPQLIYTSAQDVYCMLEARYQVNTVGAPPVSSQQNTIDNTPAFPAQQGAAQLSRGAFAR